MTAVEMEKVSAAPASAELGQKQFGRVGPFKVTPLNERRWQNF